MLCTLSSLLLQKGASNPSLPSATAPGVAYVINRHVAACQKPPTYEQQTRSEASPNNSMLWCSWAFKASVSPSKHFL